MLPPIGYAGELCGISDDILVPGDIGEARTGAGAGEVHATGAPVTEAVAREFRRSPSTRKNLVGIQQSGGIERIAHASHYSEFRFAEKQRHQAILFHAHAVLAGDRAAHGNAELDDLVGRGDHAAKLRFVARVEKYQRMEIAVARVENIANLETVLLRQLR